MLKKKGVYDKNPTNCFCCKISCIQQIESPVFDSCKIVCSKHCGSIACGSGLNILVYFAKIGMLWLNRLVRGSIRRPAGVDRLLRL